MGIAELVEGRFDSRFLVSRNFVPVLFELFFRLENHRIGGIELIHALAGFFVLVGMLGCFGAHTGDFSFRESGRSLDADFLFLPGAFIFSGNAEDTAGVNIEGDLDHGHAAGCRRDTVQDKAPDGAVVARHGALALEHVNLDGGLVVGSGRIGFGFFGRNGRVGFDDDVIDTAHGLDAQRQRGHV